MARFLLLLMAGLLFPAWSLAYHPPTRCGTLSLPPAPAASSPKPLQTNLLRPFAAGDTLTFPAFDFGTGKPYKLTATCRLVGQHCYVFVQDEEWNIRVRLPQAQRLASAFDRSVAADTTRGVYDIDTSAFGVPPDVDGDPRILILILDVQDTYASTGNYFAGYFDQGNELQPVGREILYLDDRPLNLDSDLARSTLAHEFQHMIHWNADPKEAKWVDEGCSAFAEILAGYGDTVNVAGAFLSFPNVGLTDWQDLVVDYEKSSLFIAYFEDRFGLPAVRRLVQDRAQGVAGFGSTLLSIGGGGFGDLFADWTIANLLGGGGKFGYRRLKLAPLTTERIVLLPLGASPKAVKAWATRYFDFGKQSGLKVAFEAASQDTFQVRLVTVRAGFPQVGEFVLDASGRGESRSVRADRVVAVALKRGGPSPVGNFYISAEPFQPSMASLCDFDGDGLVGFGDFFLFAEGFGRSSGHPGYNPGLDLDGDGAVGLEDFFQFVLQFGARA